jgi:hypothetical protein
MKNKARSWNLAISLLGPHEDVDKAGVLERSHLFIRFSCMATLEGPLIKPRHPPCVFATRVLRMAWTRPTHTSRNVAAILVQWERQLGFFAPELFCPGAITSTRASGRFCACWIVGIYLCT